MCIHTCRKDHICIHMLKILQFMLEFGQLWQHQNNPACMAINICHQCLVRSQPFAGTCRFLASLFTFLSKQPNVNQLRTTGRNWFRTIITTKKQHVRVFIFIFVGVDCSYIALFSALEQTHCTLVTCDSKCMTRFLQCALNIHPSGVVAKLFVLNLTRLVPLKTATILVHSVCII